MELGSGDGKPQTTVVQPATEAHVEHGHIPVSTTSISCSNLRAGGRAARAAPSICQHHMPPNVCTGPICDDLHICRLYLDGFCPREDTDCRWGHVIKSAGNCNSLKAYHLQGVPEDDLMWFARSLMRQTASVSLKDYRQELMLCEEYSSGAQCDRDDCFKIHLCPRLVAGRCPDGSQCGWNHQLSAPENLMILLRLKCATLTDEEVLARLGRHREEMRESVSSSSGVDSQMTTSSSVTEDRPERSNSGDETETVAADDEVPCEPPGEDDVNEEADDKDDEDGEDEEADHKEDEEADHKDGEYEEAKDKNEEDEDVEDDHGAVSRSPGKEAPDSPDVIFLKSLDICVENIYPSRCHDSKCSKLHLCRLYVAGICPYGGMCKNEHLFISSHNERVLSGDSLQRMSKDDILATLRKGHLSRHPILDIEREHALQICWEYQWGRCGLPCTRLHICQSFAAGGCKGEDGCDRSHDLGDPVHDDILTRFGLKSASEERLLAIATSTVTPYDVRDALMYRLRSD